MDEKNITPKLLKSGFLVKKGGAKEKNILENWQKRWFTLKYKPLSETHEIEYFKNNTPNSNPLGLIVLSNKCSIAPSTRKGIRYIFNIHVFEECCLSLMTPEREYFFCAKDHVEMEEWRKAIMEAIHNSRNIDTSLNRSYSTSAFFTRTSTESTSDDEGSFVGTQNNSNPPNSPPQSHNHSTSSSSNNTTQTSVPNSSQSPSSPQPSSNSQPQSSNGENGSSSSSSNGNTANISKRLAENKQILEEFPFLLVALEDLKWGDVPRLLEQYKRMALTTLVKENRL